MADQPYQVHPLLLGLYIIRQLVRIMQLGALYTICVALLASFAAVEMQSIEHQRGDGTVCRKTGCAIEGPGSDGAMRRDDQMQPTPYRASTEEHRTRHALSKRSSSDVDDMSEARARKTYRRF